MCESGPFCDWYADRYGLITPPFMKLWETAGVGMFLCPLGSLCARICFSYDGCASGDFVAIGRSLTGRRLWYRSGVVRRGWSHRFVGVLDDCNCDEISVAAGWACSGCFPLTLR